MNEILGLIEEAQSIILNAHGLEDTSNLLDAIEKLDKAVLLIKK
jgi:hypothetical protein